MKANRAARIRDADDGASVIVGAVLLFALSFLVLVMIQSNFVPVWEQDAEAAHHQTVQSQLAFLKSQMERQTEGTVTTPLSSPIDLERGGVSNIFGSRNIPPGTLELSSSDAAEFKLSSPEISITTVSDPQFVGLGETWEEIDGDTIEDASRIASLEVRIPSSASEGSQADLTITDADGAFAGRLRIILESISSSSCGSDIRTYDYLVRTYNAADDLIREYSEKRDPGNSGGCQQSIYVNALDPNYRFGHVLAAAETPFEITLTESGGMGADFSAAYYQQISGGGEVLVGGGSETVMDYEETTGGSRLVYESFAQHFIQQDLIMEYGAIIVAQSGGASVASSPAFAVGSTAERTSFSWTTPRMVPGAESFATARTDLIVTTASGHQTLTGTAPRLTIELATDYPGAWTTYWRNAFERAGLTEGDEFSLASTATSASFTLEGPLTDSTHDVSIAIQTAQVEVLL